MRGEKLKSSILTKDEIAAEKVFCATDADKSGYVDIKELSKLLDEMSGGKLLLGRTSNDVAAEAFNKFAKGSKTLSKTSFLAWWRTLDQGTIDVLLSNIAGEDDVAISITNI